MDTHTLLTLAGKYKTPLYIYDAEVVRSRYSELKSFCPYSKVKIHYAMKANYNPHILRLLFDMGCGIDAVSISEILLAKKVGFDVSNIIYTANMITDAEMHEVAALGVLFNIDSLSRLEKYGKAYPGSSVCLRLNPEVVTGHHEHVKTGGDRTKFGINLEDLDTALLVCSQYGLKVVGVHEHAGSGIPEIVDMEAGMQNILRHITPVKFPDLVFVNFGGGFKIPYRDDEKRMDYHTFGKQAVELFLDFSLKFGRELEMRFEPGRYLVGEAGVLMVEVNTLKMNRTRCIVGVNSGFPQLIRPMFYGAYHHISNVTNPTGPIRVYDVVGNICETGDHFAVDRNLSEVREGDILAIHNAGAYCYSMGGIYNLRAMPTEVTVDLGKVFVRRGKTPFDLVDDVVGDLEL